MPARGDQLAIFKGLRAQANAIESGRDPRVTFSPRDGFRIGFESDFAQFAVEMRANRVEPNAASLA